MTTEYRVRLDRAACEGVFACLVRDDRFVEAPDGLATLTGDRVGGDEEGDDGDGAGDDAELVVSFADERVDDAEQAARACPVDAIDVLTEGDDE